MLGRHAISRTALVARGVAAVSSALTTRGPRFAFAEASQLARAAADLVPRAARSVTAPFPGRAAGGRVLRQAGRLARLAAERPSSRNTLLVRSATLLAADLPARPDLAAATVGPDRARTADTAAQASRLLGVAGIAAKHLAAAVVATLALATRPRLRAAGRETRLGRRGAVFPSLLGDTGVADVLCASEPGARE